MKAWAPAVVGLRFHGRGGHGIKTASRIAGTAAFLEGLYAQDAPVFRGERRGAPITAYTRISREPILERGVIDHPHLILVADPSLLDEPSAGLLAGAEQASALFLNAPTASPPTLPPGLAARRVIVDLSRRTVERIGHPAALSAGLGAAASRLSNTASEASLRQAVVDEFSELHLPPGEIEANLALALDIFGQLEPVPWIQGPAPPAVPLLRLMPLDPPTLSAPSVLAPGNTSLRHTGVWRSQRPSIDPHLCLRCGRCYVECPDGAIALDPGGYPVIDYDHCKGCLICQQLCPPDAISVRPEHQPRPAPS